MREIKFRAWIPANHWMLEDEKAEYIYDLQDKTALEIIGLNPEDGIIIEQYIGLKDKNGKEIYEGDIIETESCYGIVCFQDAAFQLKIKINDNIEQLRDLSTWHSMKIIGNIHENPELLK